MPLSKKRRTDLISSKSTREAPKSSRGMDLDLPPELLLCIFELLSRHELTLAAILCRSLLPLARNILYTSVDLKETNRYLQETLALFETEKIVAGKVLHIRLTTNTHTSSIEPWITPEVFQRWGNLKTLTLVGCPFRNSSGILFRDVITTSCRQLNTLLFIPNQHLEIVSSMILWNQNSVIANMQLDPSRVFTPSALTRLSFDDDITFFTGECLDQLFQSDPQFPALSHLEFGSLIECTEPQQLRWSLTQFLRREPSVKHLSLGRQRRSRELTFQFDLTLIPPDFLPNLQSFEGFPESFSSLLQANITTLQQLEKLTLVSGEDDWSDLSEMLDAAGDSTLPALRRLRVRLMTYNRHESPNGTYPKHRRCMHEFANFCPNVQELDVELPPAPLDENTLPEFFRKFRFLRLIVLPEQALELDSTGTYFGPLIAQCLQLRQVRARRSTTFGRQEYLDFYLRH
ncbi:hypothetical protein CPB83DRAFT_849687, partial [Crepidotus variabilis]